MLLIWFGLSMAVAGHLVLAVGVLRDAWRERSLRWLALLAAVSLGVYVLVPWALSFALSPGDAVWSVFAASGLFVLGATALLRVVQVGGRSLRPRLREALGRVSRAHSLRRLGQGRRCHRHS
ncbi:MAG: hypothetical protein QM765_09155 [Myxococcales bacterium]